MAASDTGALNSQWLCVNASQGGAPVVIVAAHPDDEVIGAASILLAFPGAHVIHVTDGAPRNMTDAARLGFATPAEYARTRRAEAAAALAMCGIGPNQMIALGFPDQEAALNLIEIARRLENEIAALKPAAILTHAYEGGHPDHDAAAFGVHAAVRLLPHDANSGAPPVVEFASYHADGDDVALLEFLPGSTEIRTQMLPERERARKRRMIAAHATQESTIAGFPVDRECFRPAPKYDFTLPPHPGVLHCERYDWGMTGEGFRVLAAAALDQLGLRPPI